MENGSMADIKLPEIKVDRILYVTDLSEQARQAFAWAMNQAQLYNAQLAILHVLSGTSNMAINYIGMDEWEKIRKRHYDKAKETLIGKSMEHRAIKEALERFSVLAAGEGSRPVEPDMVIVDSGDAVETILKYARDLECGLIIMANHGQGGLVKHKLGSVAHKVLQRSKVPVLIVPSL